ncbi:MAG: carboxypeptidase-like regulatory domain-containing protein [Candidatus Sulfotelmatobacter sp.]
MRFKDINLILALMMVSLSFPWMMAQETTGGLQGTVKDASGALVSNAHVVVKGTTLVGDKSLDTDAAGYYRFSNLPPPGSIPSKCRQKDSRVSREAAWRWKSVTFLPLI